MTARAITLLAAFTLLQGCMGRQILTVEDAASGRSTVLTTLDTNNYLLWSTTRVVFWECGPKGDGLTCEQRCDVKDENGNMVLCQKTAGLGGM